jgi:hypothetical protein
VLKELEIIGRITRRIEGLSEAEKMVLKDARAAFGAAWEVSYRNNALIPKGHAVVRGQAWHLLCLWRGRLRGGRRHGLGCPESGAADGKT